MITYGLLGYPLTHSFSKNYFQEKFSLQGINAKYVNFSYEKIENIKDIINSTPNIRGLNVTIPYKKKIIPFLDKQSKVVKEIQACNCIKIQENKWIGHNTDIIGFETSFIKNLDSKKHNKALVFGTGGASLAVAFVLNKLNIPFLLVTRNKKNRHSEDNQDFYEEKMIIEYKDISSEYFLEYQIIINTTPLGMYPNTKESPIAIENFSAISSNHYFYDLIYNPEQTLFLKQAKNKGAFVKNGLEMLKIQAEKSYEIWNS